MNKAPNPIARLSDEELLGRVFEIDDPREQDNYIEIIPENAKVVECETFYDLKSWRYPCGISSCRTKHMKGLGVLLDDGHRSNIGHNCGTKHFGAVFDDLKSRMQYNARRAGYLRRREPLDRMISEAVELLTLWRAPLRDLGKLKRDVAALSRTLHNDLEQMYLRQGGEPRVTKKIRDRPAEQRRDDRIKEDHPEYGKPIYQMTEVSFGGKLPGISMVAKIDASRLLSDTAVELRLLIAKTEDEGLTNSELQAMFTKLTKCADDLTKIADLHDDARLFCTKDVWKRIAEWQGAKNPNDSIKFQKGYWRNEYDSRSLALTEISQSLSRRAIEVLRERPDLETIDG